MSFKPRIAGLNPAQGISVIFFENICPPRVPLFAFPCLHYLPLLTCIQCTYVHCTCTCTCMYVYMCVHVQTRDNLLNHSHVNYSETPNVSPTSYLPSCLPLSLSAGLRETSFQQMFVDGRRSGRDDLLFYVMYDHNEDRDTVEFMRRDSKTLPRYTGTCIYMYTQCIHSGAPWVLCARQFMCRPGATSLSGATKIILILCLELFMCNVHIHVYVLYNFALIRNARKISFRKISEFFNYATEKIILQINRAVN